MKANMYLDEEATVIVRDLNCSYFVIVRDLIYSAYFGSLQNAVECHLQPLYFQ